MTSTAAPNFREMGRKSAQTRRIKAIEDRIRALVESAPPLSDEQRRKLAGLLAPDAAA